nr:ATP-grasp domain-containing protein [Aeoliella straminimaris]
MFPNYCNDLETAIEQQGHTAHLVDAPKPPYRWDDVQDSYRHEFPAGSCVVAHGDIELITRIGRDEHWTPGVFATVENYHCTSYFPHFGQYLLNSDYTMLPFGELLRQQDFLFNSFGNSGQVFVRPDSPLKLFAGQLAKRDNFAADVEFMGFYEFPLSSLVVVSSPKSIAYEWRFVVADRRVVAGCQYVAGNEHVFSAEYPSAARELADEVAANEFQPDPVWIIDICQTTEGDYRLLEIGGFSFANLYACNMTDVVSAVSQTARRVWEEQQSASVKDEA